MCIPDDAILLGEYEYVGGTGKGREYRYNQTLFGATSDIILTVTDDCMPISVHSVDETAVGYSVGSGNYFGLTLGIRDPSVFDVPSFCFDDNSENLVEGGDQMEPEPEPEDDDVRDVDLPEVEIEYTVDEE
ncbi:ependymin-related protein 1-like [Glandiceps talaboti]